MCDLPGGQRRPIELADIFSNYAETYLAKHGASVMQHKAIHAITRCRTAELGGHTLRCNHCGKLEIAYNSCRYRHCPKCQTPKQLRWLEERKAELLPVPYFHVVFTIPHELNPIASYNPAAIYNLLFKAAWRTIDTLGRDKKRLNGQMGMLAFLHTWGQTLNQHIHLHCMIPAGAICSESGNPQWRPSKQDYLFPNKVMSKLFGKYFLTALDELFKQKTLVFKGCIANLAESAQFMKFKAQLRNKSWNVYAKEPFNGAEGGIEYLGRYVSKTAIGNERLLSCDNQQVTFKWRDYADDNKTKLMKLDAHEFIRRYLTHILPHRFMRVRYFGFLANATKRKNITTIRSLLSSDQQNNTHENNLSCSQATEDVTIAPKTTALFQAIGSECDAAGQNLAQVIHQNQLETLLASSGDNHETKKSETLAELMKRVVGIDIEQCKHCKIGRLEKIGVIKPSILPLSVNPWDTS